MEMLLDDLRRKKKVKELAEKIVEEKKMKFSIEKSEEEKVQDTHVPNLLKLDQSKEKKQFSIIYENPNS